MENSLEDAELSYKVSKTRKAAESSVHFKQPEYVVGSKLWINKLLFKDAYSNSQESDKLSANQFGPFEVTELIGLSVRLDLGIRFKIHPFVHFIHTIPSIEQPDYI